MQFLRRELAALALVGTALPFAALANDPEAVYPQRPVTLVIGYPPGGDADALARILSRHMADDLGQRLIVDYKPGAAGNIGAESVARADADGYTIYLGARPNTIHKTMYGHLKYDFSRDLVPIGLTATMPYVIVAGAHASIHTVPDILRLARTYPGGLACASSGVGSTSHLLCELLQQETGVDLLHIPYKGTALALTDVMGGRIDLQIAPVPAALPHIRSGKLHPVAVMSRLRVPTIPNVPTIEEAGVPGLDLEAWYGLMAPAGTPPRVIDRLNRAINAALLDPDLRDSLTQLSYAPPLQPNTASAFGELIAEETERWSAILRIRNIKPLH
ncbi:Bug family tripartite tricarboxylate transporter substrate binding protein [Bordetella bronchialis]|uniref:MFS transporter n=1 Tax=Bordetella bronchialis TaxID=463025 RepID=A0A193FKP5_9BORD|nr:tripartite tricarboxylate transporter substrate binding protein [Bordetella bronchialis]ANN68240.1 hypothetical protein BAU06_19780 [Bordetella bronchialis]ANN73371.1 hypothetical protein BAU08_20275 [Bordetella bronchialis]